MRSGSPSDYRDTWARKPQLRAVYEDLYRDMRGWLAPGRTLEIGAGSGNLKEYMGDLIATDVVPAPWLDIVTDAHTLPFADASLANIVGFDVVHHLEHPRRFFLEADRVLAPGGRVILVEPAMTPVSEFFYRRFHPEPVDFGVDPLADGPSDPARTPFDSNQAIPTLLWGRDRRRWSEAFPRLLPLRVEPRSFVAYALSGGFRDWSMAPTAVIRAMLRVERRLLPVLGRLAAFRMLVVLERQRSPGGGAGSRRP